MGFELNPIGTIPQLDLKKESPTCLPTTPIWLLFSGVALILFSCCLATTFAFKASTPPLKPVFFDISLLLHEKALPKTPHNLLHFLFGPFFQIVRLTISSFMTMHFIAIDYNIDLNVPDRL